MFEKYTNNTINYYSILIKKIYDETKNESNEISYDFGIDDNDVDFKIKNCLIIINKSDENSGLFTPSLKNDIVNNMIIDCEIRINYTKEENIIQIAAHELLHCHEYIKLNNYIKKTEFEEVKELRKTMSFKINKAYLNISGETIKTINNEYEKFMYVVRNTFNSEYNARTTQLYGYLLKFEPEYIKLKDELLKSKTMMIYNEIEKYTNTNIYDRLINIGEENLLNITNKFNYFLIENNVSDVNGYEFIKKLNKNELNSYYNKWCKLFKYKNNKHYEKIMNSKFIDDIIKRKNDVFRQYINENYFISEHHDDQFHKWMEEDRIKNLRIKKINRLL